MRPAASIAVTFCLAIAISACQAEPAEIVWPEGATFGAELIPCPSVDCSAVMTAARRGLDRRDPSHAMVVGTRLAKRACAPDGNALCAYSTPIGSRDQFVVVLDLKDGPPVLVQVVCWVDRPDAQDAVAWNGQWCEGFS